MKTPIIEGIDKFGLESYLTERLYEQLYWPTIFPLKNVDVLDGKTLIGDVGSRVAAHIISYDARAPEAGRKDLVTKAFDIPKIVQSRRKTEKEILELHITRAMRGQDAVIEDYFNDIDFVYDSCMARMEWLALTALGNTTIQLSTTNNPQGIINETVIDFGMSSTRKKTVAVIWSTGNAATMTPITDFKAVVKAGRDLGMRFERILMHPDAFDLLNGSTQFQTACKSLLLGEASILGYMGLETVNKVLNALRLPSIALIDTSINIEDKHGDLTASNPFSSTHVVFVPSIALGKMYNGPIAEEIEPPEQVVQSKKDNILLSLERTFNPVSVLAKGECNAFPSWPTIDNCMNLYTAHASTWA